MLEAIKNVLDEQLLRFISNNVDGMEWALGIDNFDRDKDYIYESDEHIVRVNGKTYKITLNVKELEQC